MPNSIATRRGFTRLALILTMGLGFAVVGGPLLPAGVAAQEDGTGRKCSVQTLRGDYGFVATGTRRLPPFLGGGTEPFNAVGMWTFHGDGSFTQSPGVLAGLGAGVSTLETETPGTYTVSPNCTGTMQLYVPDLPFPIEYAVVIVDNAREVKGIVTSGGVTTVSLTRK